jgi:hypothetical protein
MKQFRVLVMAIFFLIVAFDSTGNADPGVLGGGGTASKPHP